MININSNINILSPVRSIKAVVKLMDDDTVYKQYRHSDSLQSISIERVGDTSKFFGFGICQKANIKIRDKNKSITELKANDKPIKVFFETTGSNVSAFPRFNITEVHRDENTGALSVTAYDVLYGAAGITVNELELAAPYTIKDFATACAAKLGLTLSLVNIADDDTSLLTRYETGANFSGTETLRTALDAIAEATQTIYYVTEGALVFKRLDASGAAVLTIDKENYIKLESSDNKRLATIYHTTELGDDVYNSISQTGSIQYIKNNPFWNMRDDIATLVDNALATVGGFTIAQFNADWRGHFALEIGDKLELITKDNSAIYSYLLNDVIEYDGAFSERTEWKYTQEDIETSANPSSLGDVLNQTRARVDKVNKEIELVASDTESYNDRISTLEINTESISASVSQTQTNLDNIIESINGNISTLETKINQTAQTVKIDVIKELGETGVNKVTTSTGFTFDENGLTVSKSNSVISTQITEDGMAVFKDNTEVLTADNNGVSAVDLHARTYLKIGQNSRFEDYLGYRTGCFWIGV